MSYKTKQSEELIEFLKQNKNRHMTAEEVYGELHSNGSTVGRTTVYRHLEKLYAEGAIRKFLTGDNSGACFQYVDNPEACHNHYHLRCNSCGRLIHTDCDFLNELAEHIKDEHSFYLDTEKTVIYGVCEHCKTNEKEV